MKLKEAVKPTHKLSHLNRDYKPKSYTFCFYSEIHYIIRYDIKKVVFLLLQHFRSTQIQDAFILERAKETESKWLQQDTDMLFKKNYLKYTTRWKMWLQENFLLASYGENSAPDYYDNFSNLQGMAFEEFLGHFLP